MSIKTKKIILRIVRLIVDGIITGLTVFILIQIFGV